MMLLIKKGLTIEDAQRSFNYIYPHLTIRFYTQENLSHQRKPILKEIKGQFGGKVIEDEKYHLIDISAKRTVSQLEGDLAVLGIQTKVLRKSGTVSIEILLTREWTLERQNEEAMLLEQMAPGLH